MHYTIGTDGVARPTDFATPKLTPAQEQVVVKITKTLAGALLIGGFGGGILTALLWKAHPVIGFFLGGTAGIAVAGKIVMPGVKADMQTIRAQQLAEKQRARIADRSTVPDDVVGEVERAVEGWG